MRPSYGIKMLALLTTFVGAWVVALIVILPELQERAPPPDTIPSETPPPPPQARLAPPQTQCSFCSLSEAPLHLVPSLSQFQSLNVQLGGSAADLATALHSAVTTDCSGLGLACNGSLDASKFTNLSSAVELGATMRGLSNLISALFVSGVHAELLHLDENLPLRVATLVRQLLRSVCYWLPSRDDPLASSWPKYISDLLPPALQPRQPNRGVVICANDDNMRGVLVLVRTAREIFHSNISIEVFHFDSTDLSAHNEQELLLHNVTLRSLASVYGNLEHKCACGPLAVLASHFQQVLLVHDSTLVLQDYQSFFRKVSAFTTHGAAFFRERYTLREPGTFPDPLSFLLKVQPAGVPSWLPFAQDFGRLTNVQDGHAVVLDRTRADLGILGVASLQYNTQALRESQHVVCGPDELWWIGFSMMGVRFGFSPWVGGTIGLAAEFYLGERQVSAVCGHLLQFDDTGFHLFWSGGINLWVCKQGQWSEPARVSRSFLMVRHSVRVAHLHNESYILANCGRCAVHDDGALPGSTFLEQVSLTWTVWSRPALIVFGFGGKLEPPQPQFPSQIIEWEPEFLRHSNSCRPFAAAEQFVSLSMTQFSPADFRNALASDCSADATPLCSSLSASVLQAGHFAESYGATMRGLSRFLKAVLRPGMREQLAALSPSLPSQVSRLSRSLIHAALPWLPPPRFTDEWPSNLFDLLPPTLQPVDDRHGVAMCTGVRNLPFFLGVLDSIRNIFKSDIPIEVFYFDDDDFPPANRTLLKARSSNLYLTSLSGLFPELVGEGFLSGWDCKVFAAIATRFRQVLLLDADLVLLSRPERFFDLSGFSSDGAVFFRDRPLISDHLGTPSDLLFKVQPHPTQAASEISKRRVHVQESSAVVLDKSKVQLGLLGTAGLMANPRVRAETQMCVLGDKELFWIGFEMTSVPYTFSRWSAGSIGFLKNVTEWREKTVVKMLCGHLAQFDDAGMPLFWNGGFGLCDHREPDFNATQILHATAFVRDPYSPGGSRLTYQLQNGCGWCAWRPDMPLPPLPPQVAAVAQDAVSVARAAFTGGTLVNRTFTSSHLESAQVNNKISFRVKG